jgi:tRNA A37 threonylcarbamoyladenosine dehydratase
MNETSNAVTQPEIQSQTPPQVPNQVQDMTEAEMDQYRLHRRFDRMGRLIGDDRMKKLMNSHVMIIGLGGVGSWAAECIARSGVGEISIVDFDEICVTNFNRQLHALQGLVGSQKAEVVADRLRKINPQAKINVHAKFYNFETAEEIFAQRPDYVIDAIDHITSKTHLLNLCRERKIPIVSSAGSGGRMDPLKIKVRDLSQTENDPLARAVRKILRDKYGFPEKGPWGIQTVYSDETPTWPVELKYDNGKGFRCVCPGNDNPYFNCDSRNLILGNASFVTGTFGNVAASIVVRDLVGPMETAQSPASES